MHSLEIKIRMIIIGYMLTINAKKTKETLLSLPETSRLFPWNILIEPENSVGSELKWILSRMRYAAIEELRDLNFGTSSDSSPVEKEGLEFMGRCTGHLFFNQGTLFFRFLDSILSLG